MTELSKLLEPIKSELGFLFPDDICSGILSKESLNDLSLPVQTLIGHLLKGGEGSGHYGHTGLPGVWGGSTSSGGGKPYRRSEVSKFAHARDGNTKPKYKPFVTSYIPREYKNLLKEMGAKCYLSFTGKSGYALKPDGDIISIFSSSPGEGRRAVLSAIARGGTKLDCFDGKLVKFYSQFGLVEYERWDWDDQYKPKDWDYEEFNRPDVVLMRLRGKE